MNRAEKHAQVDSLAQAFSTSSAVYCADYRGLSVADINSLRRELGNAGVSVVKVSKNTLIRLAFKKGVDDAKSGQDEKFLSLLKGPTFIAFANDDVVSAAKIFDKYGKEKQAFQVKGAWFEGNCIDAAGVTQISKLPSREETLSTLLRLISTPATQIVRVLSAPAQQMVQTLSALKDKLSN